VAITVNLHSSHRQHTGGRESVTVDGSTVGECLERLVAAHPGLRDALFDSGGALRNNIEIYLNLESTYPEELRKPTSDGDEIHVAVMLAGG
jgi:molybdopterin converting factor small subunit